MPTPTPPSRARRAARRATIAIVSFAVVLAAGCAMLSTKERELTFRPVKEDSGWFSGLPADVKEFYLPVSDAPGAERLMAWHWPNEKADAPTLLYLHGVRWNLTGHLQRIAHLRSFGFSILAIDYRGFGKSDGELPSEESVYEDALAAWRWVVAREPEASQRMIYGHSLGTAVATHLAVDAGQRDGMGGLIIEGAFTTLPEMAAALAPSWLPLNMLVTQQFDTRGKIAKVPSPVLIVHGTSDRLVPHRFSQALYEAARDPKKLVLVEGGSHYNTAWVGATAYREAIAEMFDVKVAAAQPVVVPSRRVVLSRANAIDFADRAPALAGMP